MMLKKENTTIIKHSVTIRYNPAFKTKQQGK